MQSTKTTLLIIIQIQSFEKVHLSVVCCCCRSRCYSILINGSKECYFILESGLKYLYLGKGTKMLDERNLGKEIRYCIFFLKFSDESHRTGWGFGPGAVIRTGCAVRTMPPCLICSLFIFILLKCHFCHLDRKLKCHLWHLWHFKWCKKWNLELWHLSIISKYDKFQILANYKKYFNFKRPY